ncbi:hypothetical protein FKW77_008687 [Venturia effusa]|uniref:Uncharacterized protein n=1 Tax=Venturia effusa TaxID=50376 RepID=A0A517KX19_9PEZI|nr:hypothetical protein FKW77_008687 [Venturia effusa]
MTQCLSNSSTDYFIQLIGDERSVDEVRMNHPLTKSYHLKIDIMKTDDHRSDGIDGLDAGYGDLDKISLVAKVNREASDRCILYGG